VQVGSFGFYRPNQAADGFDAEILIQSLSKQLRREVPEPTCQASREPPDMSAAPGSAFMEAAGQLLQATSGLWSERAQMRMEATEGLERERLKQRFHAKENASAQHASMRAGGA